MIARVRNITLLLAGLLLATGCASHQMSPMQFASANTPGGKYVAKVNQAVIIQDASMTMGIHDQNKLDTSKNLLTSMNQSLPPDLNMNMALRTFGHSDRQAKGSTALAYGMTKYSQDGMQKGIDSIKYAGGNSPLTAALMAAADDLKGGAGKSAIVVVSDGISDGYGMDTSPAAAEKVKAMLGPNTCIYTITVGESADGKARLDKVAQASQCGFSESASALSTSAGMGSFVEKVFLAPAAAKMAAAPMPMDSDGDGVMDDRDKCPNTPRGEYVDADGCTLKLTLHINFDFDKADIKPEFKPDLDKAANFIKKYPEVPYILIAGHTDHTGTDEYNMELSEKRAQNVRQYLIDNYGIDADRLGAKGYGKSQPIATNATAEGRYENRRVEIVCCVLKPE